jgi:hypothetical protein
MDYFQGILFLTTNRVGQFDEAFASRIHLSLGYDKLDDKARGQIWDNLFQKLTEDHRKKIGPEIQFGISTKQYVKTKEVMALQWNGREIRNGKSTHPYDTLISANHTCSIPNRCRACGVRCEAARWWRHSVYD